jgi:enoyl-CoA hydratase/carnithine racemase
MQVDSMPELVVTHRGRVAMLTLNRPDQGNRLTAQLARALAAALEEARGDARIGACVLTGAGDVFCLGGDWRGALGTADAREEYARALVAMDLAMAQLGKPLVAALNGDAHAGGFATVVACDLAIAADHATLGLPEAAAGLFPFIALAVVRDAVPKKLLFDLIYSARLMAAEEALAAHLVNETVPRDAVLERAVAVAERAAAHRPEVVELGRNLYYGTRGLPAAQALDAAQRALLAALAAQDRS